MSYASGTSCLMTRCPMIRRFHPRVESLESRDVPSATFITLTSSANPSPRGRAVIITATVAGGDFQAGTYPGGQLEYGESVTFLVGEGRPLARKYVEPVVNGVARIFIRPRPGRTVISAIYSGAIYATAPPPWGIVLGADAPSGTGPVGLVQLGVRHH